MAGDTSVDMMINVLPGTLTGIFALNAGLSSINQQFQNMTKAVDNHFGIVDAAIVSATALAVQFGKNAADAFGEYEQGMKIVQAVSGQTQSTIQELGNTANEFSVKYRMDIQELTDGLQTLGRAGLKSAQEQTEVLESGLQTAKLEGRDLNSVLEELIQNTTLLGGNLKSSNFGEQSEYVNDLLVATSMTAPINTHDVSETLKYSGGIAAAAGANIELEEGKKLLEDYMGAIAAFAQKGVKGSISGTALRAFFNKPATQDSSVKEGLSMIGLRPEFLWEDDGETMKPVSEQISLIQSQMDKKGISQMDRLQVWSKIVGGKMGQQMMKLDGSDIREVTKDIQAANSAENLATQSMQTYQSAMKQTGEAGQVAFRAFGEHVARFLTPIAKILTPILQALANPIISTGAFIGFLTLIGRAWLSIKKIFAGVRSEVGILKVEMQSLIMNQPARKQIMGGRLHGGGLVAGYEEEQKLNKMKADYYSMNQSAKSTSTIVRETGTQSELSSSAVLNRINNIRDIIVAVQNTIKETVLEINTSLNNGIKVFQGSIMKGVSQTSTQMRTQYTNSINQSSNTFNTRMSQNIRRAASQIKSEFQVALNSLTYTPKIKPTQMGVAAGMLRTHSDLGSKSFFFTQKASQAASQAEQSYQKRLESLEKKRSNIMLTRGIDANKGKAEKKLDKLTGQKESLETEIQKIKKQIDSQNKIIENANKTLSSTYKKFTAEETQRVEETKRIAIQERQALVDKSLLLQEELQYKEEEIRINRSLILSLEQLIQQINKERLALATGFSKDRKSTVVGAPGVMPGLNPHQMGTEMSQGFIERNNYLAGGYGHYTSQKSMPAVPGNFNWSNIPKEYHPTHVIGGTTAPWNFNNADRGHALLGKLRQEEVAMTREMAQALGISDKELIRFYEELIQVNAALNGLGKNALKNKAVDDTLYKTKGNIVPSYGRGVPPTQRDIRGLRSLFGGNSGLSAKEFEKDFQKSRNNVQNHLKDVENGTKQIIKEREIAAQQLSRYNLPQGVYSSNQITTGMLGSSPTSFGQAGGAFSTVSRDLIDKTVKMQETTLRQRLGLMLGASLNASGAKNITKGLKSSFKGLGGAVQKATGVLGEPFFAGMMAADIAMQIWNSAQQAFAKKVEEATQKIDEALQAQSDAENLFYKGKHEEGEREIQGWDDEHPDATSEERERALLDAYGSIYDNRTKGLGALDENTQQLAIATEEVKLATEALNQAYLDKSFFSGNGPWANFWSGVYEADQIVTKNTGTYAAGDTGYSDKENTVIDKFGDVYQTQSKDAGNYFQNSEVVLDKGWQTGEDYPWLKEFAPVIGAEIWKKGSTEAGLKMSLGGAGYARLSDIYSSIGGWDNSAWVRHGYNISNSFGTTEDQNKLQMGLKQYQKDFSKLSKQMRKFEKSTGATPLKALNYQLGKTKDMKKALKNLSVQDPKLVSYIKSLAIKTGMDEQQVLMAAQLQQLQEMQAIAKEQVQPRIESLVMSSYEQAAYGRQTFGTVQGSGSGAISAAQNAAAIAALLNAELESKLDEQSYQEYVNKSAANGVAPDQRKYKTKEDFAAAVNAARNDGQTTWLDEYAEKKFTAYAATNFRMWNPELSIEDANKRAKDWYGSLDDSAKSWAIYDTLRKGATGALTQSILAAYDASLDEQDSSGSGGSGSGKGSDKNKDTGTKKERVDLVLCNKKEIPKLNVNLFKKPPSFTILNKNFKLRDIKVNTQDKPKAVLASIKNAIIDVQKRTDPKIIQDEDAVYDPAAATDGNNVPTGKTDSATDR